MGNLKGTEDFKRRLKAVSLAFKPIGRRWADTAVDIGTPLLPVRPGSMRAGDKHEPGRLRRSIRRKAATQRKAVVAAHFTAYFIDAGVKPHSMTKRSKGQDRTVFAPKHPGYRSRPFRGHIAHESLRRHPMAETLIGEWNAGA
jgi:hypothetical protein